MDTRLNRKVVLSYLVILAMALLLSFNYYVFIIENHFAAVR